MAGRRETRDKNMDSSTFGSESEAEWIKRMSEEGALAPAANIAGFKKAVGAEKKKKSALSTIFDNWEAPSLPQPHMPTWLANLFQKGDLGSKISDVRKKITNE